MRDKGTLKKEAEKVGGEGEDGIKAKITTSVSLSSVQYNTA
jgi:hypothetical protein